MRIVVLYNNFYGQRFRDNLEKYSPHSWEIVGYLFDRPLPAVIDDPEELLPSDLPHGDLLVYVGQDRTLAELVADIAQACQVREVIAAADSRAHFPTGLARQVQRRLARLRIPAVFPVPFCSLTEDTAQGPFARELSKRFGKPRLSIRLREGRVESISVERGAPCGNTVYVAERMPGIRVEDCVEQAGLLFHAHPCMGGMDLDREIGDTVLHFAGHMVMDAVRGELEKSSLEKLTSQRLTGEVLA